MNVSFVGFVANGDVEVKKILFPLLMLMPVVGYSQQIVGTNFKQLALDAMASPSKTASADVTGPVADMIRQQTRLPNARIVVDAAVFQDLPQEGCKRIRFAFSMPNNMVIAKDGAKVPFKMSNMLNMCENGQPPESDEYAAASKKSLQEAVQRSKEYSEKSSSKK